MSKGQKRGGRVFGKGSDSARSVRRAAKKALESATVGDVSPRLGTCLESHQAALVAVLQIPAGTPGRDAASYALGELLGKLQALRIDFPKSVDASGVECVECVRAGWTNAPEKFGWTFVKGVWRCELHSPAFPYPPDVAPDSNRSPT